MVLPYSDELNIGYLSRLFDNTSECYKYFWFKAIVGKVLQGKNDMNYDELVNEMVSEAWYMVCEYHLNLGPRDSLEMLVNRLRDAHPDLKSSEKKERIIDVLKIETDGEILKLKRTLTRNVPYRLQSPFLSGLRGTDWNVGEQQLISRINSHGHLLYYFEKLQGLSTRIILDKDWAEYIIKNQEIILGWLEFNMIKYLQKRNPHVPGIGNKLYPPQERKLEKVKKYWKMQLAIKPVREIYNDQLLQADDISIDHFVPWPYVAHDEFWNLNPTTRSINSSKSNKLPIWDKYFERLAALQYESYSLMWKHDKLHDEFIRCSREHLNGKEGYNVYGNSRMEFQTFKHELETILKPEYDSAVLCGFGYFE